MQAASERHGSCDTPQSKQKAHTPHTAHTAHPTQLTPHTSPHTPAVCASPQHEMDPESFDPDDILDAASLLQFGFTLTTLSDWSLEVLEAWLIDIKDMLTVDGFDAKQVRTVLVENHTAPLQHVRARELSTRELSTQMAAFHQPPLPMDHSTTS